MIYIQRKDARQLETVDEFTTWKEARAMLSEYRLSDPAGIYYLTMFGGNFASGDSQMDEAAQEMIGRRSWGALPIFDRYESQADHDLLSR